MLGGLVASTAGTVFLFLGIALGVGLAAYAIWYIFVKLGR
jgi:hypothetical protein